MKFIAYILSAVSLIATGLPLIKSAKWWIRIFDFPRMSIAVFCLVSIILCFQYIHIMSTNKYALIFLLVIAFGFQASKIVFYTPFYPQQAKASQNITSDNTLSILITNVRMENEDTDKFINMVEKWNPDIILVNEPDENWAKAIRALDSVYAYQIKEPLSNI